jgi:hypothetical protein
MLIVLLSTVFVVFLLLTLPRLNPDCPGCGKQLPTFRKPTSLRQVLLGGWTCQACGVEVNARRNVRVQR